jgi:hypothetical protein
MYRSAVCVPLAVVVTLALPCRARAQAVSGPDGWVSLPAPEYRALRDRANPPAPRPTAAASDSVLTRIDYELRADGDAVSGRANLTIDVLRDGWSQLPIPAGLMAREATPGRTAGLYRW